MNKKPTYFLLFLSVFCFIFSSCKSEPKYSGINDDFLETTIADANDDITNSPSIEEENTPVEIIYENKETQKAHEEIVKKYGEQWDFCTCIQKGDSINKALSNSEDEDEIDKIIDRMEFVDNKCKGLLIQPNDTPEDRALHQRKVSDCLKNKTKG